MNATPTITDFHTSDLTDPCPMHVRLRREGKVIGETPSALYLGNVGHEALRLMHTRSAWTRDEIMACVIDASTTIGKAAEAEHRPLTEAVVKSRTDLDAKAVSVCNAYAQRFGDRFRRCRLIGCELGIRWTFEHPTLDAPVNFASHIDLLYRTEGGALMLDDWKFRDEAPSYDFLNRNLQLGAYFLALRYGQILEAPELELWRGLNEWANVAWVHMFDCVPYARAGSAGERSWKAGDARPESNVRRMPELTAESEPAILDALAARVRMMRDGHFPAMPGDGCRYCESVAWCPSFTRGFE